jgi:hypothetical protein
MQAQKGSRGIAKLILNLGARWRWVVNATIRPFYPLESAVLPNAQQVGPRADLNGCGEGIEIRTAEQAAIPTAS